MRRAPIVPTATATAAGLAAVLNFKAHEPTLPTASASTTTSPAAGSTAAPSASASSGGTEVATGDAIPTRYGNAQVRVTASSGKIT